MAIDIQAVEPAADEDAPASLFENRYRITVELYHKMAEAGIFHEDDPIELIEGVLVRKMTKKPPHIIATDLLDDVLHRVVPDGWFASMQNPVVIVEDDSEPEPDAQLLRGHPRDRLARPFGPADVGLTVEVSDTSYAFDRKTKLAVYARAGIPVYWIVDLRRRRVEVFSDPTGPGEDPEYRRTQIHAVGDEIPLVLDGREVARIPVADLLP